MAHGGKMFLSFLEIVLDGVVLLVEVGEKHHKENDVDIQEGHHSFRVVTRGVQHPQTVQKHDRKLGLRQTRN